MSKITVPFQKYSTKNAAMGLLDLLHYQISKDIRSFDDLMQMYKTYCTWLCSETFNEREFEFSWTLCKLGDGVVITDTDSNHEARYTHRENEDVEIVLVMSSVLCLQLYSLSNLEELDNTIKRIIHHRHLIQIKYGTTNNFPKWMPFLVYADMDMLYLLQDMMRCFVHHRAPFQHKSGSKGNSISYLAHGSMLATCACKSAVTVKPQTNLKLTEYVLSLLKGASFVLKLAWSVSLENAIVEELIQNSQAVRAQIHLTAFIENLQTNTFPKIKSFLSHCTNTPVVSDLCRVSVEIQCNLQTLQSALINDLRKIGLENAICKQFKDIALNNAIDLKDIDPSSAAIPNLCFESVARRIHMISDEDVVSEIIALWRNKYFFWIWKPPKHKNSMVLL